MVVDKMLKFALLALAFGWVSGAVGCVRQPPDSAQNGDKNQKTEQATGATGGSNTTDNKIKTADTDQNSNEQASHQSNTAPDKNQAQPVIDKYIAGVAKVSDADEYGEARKVLYGDLDGDGDEDAAAQFTIEGMGGGNNYGFYLAVFRNENGKFTAVTDEVIGGKMNRNIEFTKIENGKMYFDTKDYAKDDGACCPSIAGKTSYVLEKDKIVEVKTKDEKK